MTAVYDPGTRFVSIGSSVNPPISLTLGDTLQIDTSDVSLENTKLSFFLDQNYNKPFVGTGNSAIEVVNSGIPGNGGSRTSIHFTNRVPDILYYKFLPLQNTKIINLNNNIITIQTTTPTWKTELGFQKSQLLTIINNHLKSKKKIKDIKFI